MRITRDVYLVGGGPSLGFGLSPGQDCHVYLVESAGEAALIDCGLGTEDSRRAILANIRGHGINPETIKRLFLTHYHPDHAGGTGRWQAELNLEVSCSSDSAYAVERADPDITGLRRAQCSGLYDQGYELLPARVDHPLNDGDLTLVGDLRVTHLATPGHCLGHGAYYVTGGERTYLFTGDCVLHGGRILLQNIPDCDISAYSRSVARLNELTFDSLLPGHGSIAVTGGESHVAKAVTDFRGVGLPAFRT